MTRSPPPTVSAASKRFTGTPLFCEPDVNRLPRSVRTAASTLARSPARLSAEREVLAIFTMILAGALVPAAVLPGWLQHLAPISPGDCAMHAYRAALMGPASSLFRSPSMLAVFGVAGILTGIFPTEHLTIDAALTGGAVVTEGSAPTSAGDETGDFDRRFGPHSSDFAGRDL